jgi:hypothetical protein
LDDVLHDIDKVHSLEEELLIAKEVSIRLHSELEQTENWRFKTEKLNKDLKYKIDELKDQMELEASGFWSHWSAGSSTGIQRLCGCTL